MKKLLVFAAFAVTVVSGYAASKKDPYVPFDKLPPEVQKARIAAAQENRLRRHGGDVEKPGSQKGLVLFVNGQSSVPAAEVQKVAAQLAEQSKLNIKVAETKEKVTPKNAAALKASLKADIAVFLVECSECETILLNAPENGWAIVNAATLFKDAKNDIFKAARLRKEAARAFYAVGGAMNSQYPGSMMAAIRKPSDLDRIVEDVPVDVLDRTLTNLERLGVTQLQVTSYRLACEQGWAPAPTNEYQKAIWEKVHQVPTKGLEIKYDPKKGK